MDGTLEDQALTLLRTGTKNPDATFRDGQWQAIEALVKDRGRELLVRRTGWGKSIVYFIATVLLRRSGAGPTLIISPLLALMRNQLEAAGRMGLRSRRIDSTNPREWDPIYEELRTGEIDLLLVSPERLGNREFLENAGTELFARLGMLVVDEAHCISDWGHDFRPHYRLIANFVRFLPPNVPMLATTATADEPVIRDVRDQLGGNVRLSRGELVRKSLHLDTITDLSYAGRLAWLGAAVASLPKSGIVYTITKRDANIVAEWLQSRGINALAYHGGIEPEVREEREDALLNDDVKALVANSALGMGFDKSDIGFVVHFQSTQSIVHYYQQVGRAGRAIDRAIGVLLGGAEDDDIFEYFIKNALPSEELVDAILAALEQSEAGLSTAALMAVVNVPKNRIDAAIEFLSLQTPSPIVKAATRWARTAVPFEYPREKAQALAERRRADRAAMVEYAKARSCLMQQLANSLGDGAAGPCGRCFACTGAHLIAVGNLEALTIEAEDFLSHQVIRLNPRKKWPEGGLPAFDFRSNSNIRPELQAEEGRALAFFQIGAVGRRLRTEKYLNNRFSDLSVEQAAEVIRTWAPQPGPAWVAPMVSQRHPHLVPEFAERLAEALGVRYVDALRKTRTTEEQKGMDNSSFRAKNLDGSLEVIPFEQMEQPGLFVDDMYDSGWTVTVAIALLRKAGAGIVYPFTLSKASGVE